MTARVAPDTKFNDLLGSVLDILSRARSNEFELRKIEKDASALYKVDPSGSLEVRAHVAAAKGDDDLTDDLFERAMTITDSLEGTVMRYLIVLGALGRAEDVHNLYCKYETLIGANPTALRTAAQVLAGSGWFNVRVDIDRRLEKMGVERAAQQGRTSLDSFNDFGIEAIEFTKPISFARRFLRFRNHGAISTRIIVVPKDEGDSGIFFEFLVGGEAEFVAELEWDLFSAMNEQDFLVVNQCKLTIALAPSDLDSVDDLLH